MQSRVHGWVLLGSLAGLNGVGAGCDDGGAVAVPALAAPGAFDVAAEGAPGPRQAPFGVTSSSRAFPWARGRADFATRVSRSERTTQPVVVSAAPLDFDAQDFDNLACERALALPDAGAVNVPATGGKAEGCAAASFSQRYFSVTVRPGELVTVRFDSDAVDGRLWLASGTACERAPGACFDSWAWYQRGLALAGTPGAAVTHVVSVIADSSAADLAYDLVVERTPLAANASCADALPLDGVALKGDFTAAGVEPVEAMLRRALYYTLEIPPMTRARVRVASDAGLFAYLRRGCDGDLFAAGDELSNTGDAPLVAEVLIGSSWHLAAGPFELAVDFAPLADEAACDRPAELAVGDRVELALEQGGAGPATCWCFQVTRALHAAVAVPAGKTLELVADAESGAMLIELPGMCAAQCGDNSAFGWTGTPARLVLANDGEVDVVRQVLVTANALWHEDGTSSYPPVTLDVRAFE